MSKITDDMKYVVSEGDVVMIQNTNWDYSERVGKPFKAIILWCGINGQPLITKMEEYKPFYTTYESIVKIDGHINLDKLFGIDMKE